MKYEAIWKPFCLVLSHAHLTSGQCSLLSCYVNSFEASFAKAMSLDYASQKVSVGLRRCSDKDSGTREENPQASKLLVEE